MTDHRPWFESKGTVRDHKESDLSAWCRATETDIDEDGNMIRDNRIGEQ